MDARKDHPDHHARTALVVAALRGFISGTSRALASWLLSLWVERN